MSSGSCHAVSFYLVTGVEILVSAPERRWAPRTSPQHPGALLDSNKVVTRDSPLVSPTDRESNFTLEARRKINFQHRDIAPQASRRRVTRHPLLLINLGPATTTSGFSLTLGRAVPEVDKTVAGRSRGASLKKTPKGTSNFRIQPRNEGNGPEETLPPTSLNTERRSSSAGNTPDPRIQTRCIGQEL